MIAHLSIASAAPTTPASSTEQETLSALKEVASISPASTTEQKTSSGLLEHPEKDEPLIMLHESSQGRFHDQESVVPKSGYVLMINNYDFPQNRGYLDLYSEFKTFGFRTRRDELLTTSEMLKAVKDTSERDFSNDDCFVCVIVSHGSKDRIYGTDNEAINLDTIATLFNRDTCPSLYGKPKIFLIEACQRSQTDKEPDSVPLLPPDFSEADFLICHASTSPHIKSPYKKSAYGSRKERPIYSVAKELKSESSTVDIKMIMTSPSMQQWQLVSTLTKKVFFNRKMEHSVATEL